MKQTKVERVLYPKDDGWYYANDENDLMPRQQHPDTRSSKEYMDMLRAKGFKEKSKYYHD